MSFEIVNAMVGILTTIVIAVTAIAALQQLRHLRASNQLTGLLKVLDIQQEPVFRESAHFVRSQLAEKMNDFEFRSGLELPAPDLTVHKELWLCATSSRWATTLKYDLIGEEAFLDQACDVVIQYWKLLSPAIEVVRSVRGPSIFDNFEYLWRGQSVGFRKYPMALPARRAADRIIYGEAQAVNRQRRQAMTRPQSTSASLLLERFDDGVVRLMEVFDACLFLDESQQPTLPHSRHNRR